MSKLETEKTIVNLDHIPAIPSAVIRLIRILDNPDSSVSEIVSSIETSVCAKVLSIANSAYYSRLRKVESIEHAIGILGRNTIREIVLGITVFSMFSVKNYDTKFYEYKKFWHRTITSTQLAMMFGKILKNPDLSKIYTIGILHDIGEMVFFLYFSEDYKKIQSLIEKDNLSLIDAEKSIFGQSHAEVGKLLAIKWSFPEDMIRVINYHNDPQKLKDNLDEFRLGMIIHAADSLAEELLKDPEWEEIFKDEERLKKLFSGMNSLAKNLIKELLNYARQTSVLGDREFSIDEELDLASESIMTIIETLLSRAKKRN